VPRATHRAHKEPYAFNDRAIARARVFSLIKNISFLSNGHPLSRSCKRSPAECGMQSAERASHRKRLGRERDSRQRRRRFRRLRFAIAEYATALSRAKETSVPLRISVTASVRGFPRTSGQRKEFREELEFRLSSTWDPASPSPTVTISLRRVVSSFLEIEGNELARSEASATFHSRDNAMSRNLRESSLPLL